jgi:hypothetical protein
MSHDVLQAVKRAIKWLLEELNRMVSIDFYPNGIAFSLYIPLSKNWLELEQFNWSYQCQSLVIALRVDGVDSGFSYLLITGQFESKPSIFFQNLKEDNYPSA